MKQCLLVLLLFVTVRAAGQQLEQNDIFPVQKLSFYQPGNNLKIVVFVPSLYYSCEYASMLTTALNYYFVQGLAFTPGRKPGIDVILVVNDRDRWMEDGLEQIKRIRQKQGKEISDSAMLLLTMANPLLNEYSTGNIKNQNQLAGMHIAYDEEGKWYQSVGVKTFQPGIKEAAEKPLVATISKSAILFLLDKNNKILLKDMDYRAQGEHLKPLENLVKKELNMEDANAEIKPQKLKVGDKAPGFELAASSGSWQKINPLQDTAHLKILTFYPAAFSGILPDFSFSDRMTLMSCAIQVRSFDKNPFKNALRTYAISASTNELLSRWQVALRTHNTIYLNDNDYAVSKRYNAYNEMGYDNRVTYIIDKKGIIKYIDSDYTYEDEQKIQQVVARILKQE